MGVISVWLHIYQLHSLAMLQGDRLELMVGTVL